jgi:hypothetical protein
MGQSGSDNIALQDLSGYTEASPRRLGEERCELWIRSSTFGCFLIMEGIGLLICDRYWILRRQTAGILAGMELGSGVQLA